MPAPTIVRTLVTEDPITRTLQVHLLGDNAPPQTTPGQNRPYVLSVSTEDTPIYRGTITLRDELENP